MLIMFLNLYYRQPALTLSPCVTEAIIAKTILFPGLNDATSAVESFPVFSFPQAFAPLQPTFEDHWTNGSAVVIILS